MKEIYVLFDSNDGGRVLEHFRYSSEKELDRLVEKRIHYLKANHPDNAWIVFRHFFSLMEIPEKARVYQLSLVYDRMSNTIRESDQSNVKNSFNHIHWLDEFNKASKKERGFRPERKRIFENTVKLVQAGSYFVNGDEIPIDNQSLFSEYFEEDIELRSTEKVQTKFSVINADCLETAKILKEAGLDPCVLNLANRHNPGGGVIKGSGAQEENLFRRTNLFKSLFQYIDYGEQYGVERHEHSYPLNVKSGGIYTGNATVFRGSENNGYCLLKKPFKMDFVSVAALNQPRLIKRNNLYYLSTEDTEYTKNRIRTILRIAGKFKHDSVVLGAFGCGAFKNPPNHIAEIFREVFLESEFHHLFKLVVFSIIEDRNSWLQHNPMGNVLPFLDVFDR